MTGAGRAPHELIDELGAELDAAFRRSRDRPARFSRRGLGRLAGVIAVIVGVGVPTAAATTSIFTPSPPLPRLAARAVILGRGQVAGEPWQIVVSRCHGPPNGVSVLVQVATGAAGSPCGAPVQPPTTLYDPGSARLLVFGVVPPGAAEIDLVLGPQRQRVAPAPADAGALAAAGLPRGSRLYVAAIAPDQAVTAMTAFDATGHLVLVCQPERCGAP